MARKLKDFARAAEFFVKIGDFKSAVECLLDAKDGCLAQWQHGWPFLNNFLGPRHGFALKTLQGFGSVQMAGDRVIGDIRLGDVAGLWRSTQPSEGHGHRGYEAGDPVLGRQGG